MIFGKPCHDGATFLCAGLASGMSAFASLIGKGQAGREKDNPIDANTATTDIDIEFAGSGGNFGGMGSRVSGGLCEPSRIGKETSRRRLNEALLSILAHLFSSI